MFSMMYRCFTKTFTVVKSAVPVLDNWKFYSEELAKRSIGLVAVEDELIDRFWVAQLGRPPQPNTPINALPLEYAGLLSAVVAAGVCCLFDFCCFMTRGYCSQHSVAEQINFPKGVLSFIYLVNLILFKYRMFKRAITEIVI